ncbi:MULTISPECIES: fibronectin type III domain-containing protein [Amniculibacterium]|uniref:fibronectin type III domain-containing protein n=1 Tax=Amniculibacterium TaxID=2715289 RepID=UPI000F5AFFD5|nr:MULTISPECIES: fibronectin type III domain-containing protein [Amniculibacterium]
MKRVLLSCFAALGIGASAQITVNESFESTTTPTGWAYSGFSRTTTSPRFCAGTAGLSRNFYGGNAGNLVYTSNVSNGGDLAVSFQYKTLEYSSGSGVGGTLKVEYSIDGGTTYAQLGADVALSSVTSCTTFTGNIPAGTIPAAANFKFRISNQFISGDYWLVVDDVKLNQTATTAPACTTITAPTAGATGVASGATLSWNVAPGATSYVVNMGTTPGGTDVMNGVDVGNVTSYSVTPGLLYNTQYYVNVLPKNNFGLATGCTETSFTTTATVPCPAVSAPTAGAFGQSLTPTISWGAVAGATSYTVTVGSSAGASDVVAGVDVGNVTSYTFATPLSTNTKYYYTINAIAGASSSSSCTERDFTTMCDPFAIPYFEGFENGYTHNTAVAGCLSQANATGTSTNVWTANNTLTDYNRAPRTGSWNAFLKYSSDRWMFIPVQLTAGTSYTVKLFARQDGATATNSNVGISYGTSASAAAMTNVVAAPTGIINGDYQQVSGSFTPATTGTYVVGIKGYMNGSPWYISLDDISIDVAAACIEPNGVTSSAPTATSYTLTWTAPPTAPAGGYDVYYSTSNTPPDASTAPTLTGLTGLTTNVSNLQPLTEYYSWVRSNCSATEKSTWFYGGKVTTLTFCPNVTAPANNATGVSTTPTITWDAVNGATNYNITVGSTPGASDVVAGVDLGNVTSYTFATPLLNDTPYYYTINADNGTVYSNSCTERMFRTMCLPYTVPYNEGFENGYTHDSPVAGCLSQASQTGTGVWKANNTFTDYNRTPRTGSWNAFLIYGNEDWLFIPIQLTAGITYTAKVYARQDGATASNSNVGISYGTSASASAMTNVVAAPTGIVNGDYQKISGNFTVPTTGTYVVGIKGYMNGTPWYVSLDDISIEEASSCIEPTALATVSATATSANISWTAPVGTAPANGYAVYYTASSVVPDATTVASQTSATTTAALTGLTSDTQYYVWVKSLCSTTESSSWAGPLMVTTGYCPPTGGSSSQLYYLGNVSTTGGVTNLAYTASSYQAYDNQVATTFSGTPGTAITVNILPSSSDAYYYVWVDWNNDFKFDGAGEVVLATTSYTTSATATINIPAGQAAGDYRVRMAQSYIGAVTPCGPAAYGNYVDFTLSVGALATAEVATKDNVKIYPNPFVDVLNVSDVKDVRSVTITDASGRLVKTIAKPTTELHLGDLKTGMYLVTLHYKDGSVKTMKAMKK